MAADRRNGYPEPPQERQHQGAVIEVTGGRPML